MSPTLARRIGEIRIEIDANGAGRVPGGVLQGERLASSSEPPPYVEQRRWLGRSHELVELCDRDQRRWHG
jgi:hypothetical protein